MSFSRDLTARAAPVAAGSDAAIAILIAPYDGTVTGVTFTPDAAITGAATNNRTVALVNKGQAGAGTTSIASLNFASGTNAPANDETAITLTATTADRNVTKGDVLQFTSTHIGTGIADPGGLVKVAIQRGTR